MGRIQKKITIVKPNKEVDEEDKKILYFFFTTQNYNYYSILKNASSGLTFIKKINLGTFLIPHVF